MLQFAQVKKEYGDQTILAIGALTIPEGLYWLKGPNSSGKTTLLKMVAGLIPYSGDILMKEVSQQKNPANYRRLVSLADAEPGFPPFLTGLELIRFYNDIRKASSAETGLLIDKLGFGQFLSTPVGTYSSGMIKRLSLLLAFIGHTRLILLDEPLATLDVEAAAWLPKLIREYQIQYQSSFIFSSHIPLSEAEHIPCRILQLDHHNIVEAE
jgi:ABC-2 type transport system ATP-binding protein